MVRYWLEVQLQFNFRLVVCLCNPTLCLPDRIFWAIGLLASGQVATISLTYAGQLVMTGLLGVKVQCVCVEGGGSPVEV